MWNNSLEEAFECFWRSFADEHNNFNKIDQKKRTIEQIILQLEPHDYWIYYVNIDLRHQYGISVSESQTFISTKTSPVEGSEEKWLFLQTILCTEGNSTQNEAHPFDICVKMLASIISKRILQFFPHSAYALLQQVIAPIFTVLLEHLRAFKKASMFMQTLPDYLGVSYM